MNVATADPDPPVVLVAARDEADRIGDTVRALRAAFPGAHLVVADDGSGDGTSEIAMAAGAEVVRRGRPHGKGGNMTAAAHSVLDRAGEEREPVFLLCDGDLGASAGALARLVAAVAAGECDLAVGAFRRRRGGGFGVALGFARWAIRRRAGISPVAPISGQRALTSAALRAVVPFAAGYGMEVGMTIDAVRAGFRLREYELDLEHRATGRSLGGFWHRFRQLLDSARVYLERRETRDERRAT
ncbi:MAG TPA: glycosyltransferase [Solirubrobacterales bacterium]|nr:glycosyltransferase [Solirubrobacterales bacterium]